MSDTVQISANNASSAIYKVELLDDKSETYCRMWKITEQQYGEVKAQEGAWYGEEILLGEDAGVPIYTITNGSVLGNILCPSDNYIKTIALGLIETHNLNKEKIADYLLEKNGIKGNLKKNEILNLCAQLKPVMRNFSLLLS